MREWPGGRARAPLTTTLLRRRASHVLLCRVQPLVTPYYCPMCGLYATSEEQLRMHMLGEWCGLAAAVAQRCCGTCAGASWAQCHKASCCQAVAPLPLPTAALR